MGVELAEVYHAASAAVGQVALVLRGCLLHLGNQFANFVFEDMGESIQMASGPRLAIEAHGVPLGDVGELAGKFAHALWVVGADDGGNADGDVTSAGGVHLGPDGVGKGNKVDQVVDPGDPLQDG